MNKSQNQNIFSVFHSHKMHLLALFRSFLGTEMTDFPNRSYAQVPLLDGTSPYRPLEGVPQLFPYRHSPNSPKAMII